MRRSCLTVVTALALAALAACTSSSGSGADAPDSPATSAPTSVATSAQTSSVPTSSAPTSTAPETTATSGPETSTAPPTSTAPQTDTTSPSPAATKLQTLRPVTADGHVADGFTVGRFDGSSCSAGSSEPKVSNDPRVHTCLPGSTGCIAAAKTDMLYCMRYDSRTELIQVRADSGIRPQRNTTPLLPMYVDLADGQSCSIRVGGAASESKVNPDWVPYYFCGDGASVALWAPMNSATPFDRGSDTWTVEVGTVDKAEKVAVRAAYYVGVAD